MIPPGPRFHDAKAAAKTDTSLPSLRGNAKSGAVNPQRAPSATPPAEVLEGGNGLSANC